MPNNAINKKRLSKFYFMREPVKDLLKYDLPDNKKMQQIFNYAMFGIMSIYT